jgi:hypothetical protein
MNETPIGARPPYIKVLTILLVLALIAGAGYLYYRYSTSERVLKELPAEGNSVEFTDTGLTERFVFSNYALLSQPKERVGNAEVYESALSPVSGEKIVLAALPDEEGTVLGIVHSNGNFEPVVVDGTEKVDLHVMKDGTAVFAVLYDVAVWPEDAADSDDDVEETGAAEGPVSFEEAPPMPLPAPVSGMLYAFNVQTRGEVRSLGAGRSPRITADGALIAITPAGLAEVNPATGARTILAAYKNGDSIGSTISANGSIALLHREGNAVADVFHIANGVTSPAGSIVSLDQFYGASFIDDSHLLLRTGKDQAALYTLPTDTATLKPPTVSLSIISPE